MQAFLFIPSRDPDPGIQLIIFYRLCLQKNPLEFSIQE